MELVSWSSTPLLRHALLSIEHRCTFQGKDENDNPIFDKSKPLPKLTYRATVKIHGMNCSMVFDTEKRKMQPQSRTQILSTTETCNGFYNFALSPEISQFFWNLVTQVALSTDRQYKQYGVFGEWAGLTIQKKVAVSKVPKFFTVFGVVGIDEEGEKHPIDDDLVYLLMHQLKEKPTSIYHSLDFPSFIFELDFNRVQDWLPNLNKIVSDIELCCPVGAHFGQEGTGEGLVFKCLSPGWQDTRYWFKLKGEKHKSSKDKTLSEDKIAIQNSVQDFVEYACTENRMEQGVDLVFGQKDETPTKEKIAEYLRWVVQDILKEEQDTLAESGMTPKDVTKAISAKARSWFVSKY